MKTFIVKVIDKMNQEVVFPPKGAKCVNNFLLDNKVLFENGGAYYKGEYLSFYIITPKQMTEMLEKYGNDRIQLSRATECIEVTKRWVKQFKKDNKITE